MLRKGESILRLYAVENEKTMTQVINDFIDSLKLKDKKLEKHQSTPT